MHILADNLPTWTPEAWIAFVVLCGGVLGLAWRASKRFTTSEVKQDHIIERVDSVGQQMTDHAESDSTEFKRIRRMIRRTVKVVRQQALNVNGHEKQLALLTKQGEEDRKYALQIGNLVQALHTKQDAADAATEKHRHPQGRR